MRPSRRHRTLLVALLLVALAAAATVSLALPRSQHPRPLSLATTGAFELSNSRDGLAIFAAHNLAPGGATSGEVTLGNTGSRTGVLSLDASPPRIAVAGTALASRLRLSISDTTGGAEQRIYSGPLAATPAHTDLIDLPPGAKRSYRFDVLLPDGGPPSSSGAGDNAYQGTAVSVDYLWGLTATATTACGNEIRGTMSADALVGTAGGDKLLGLRGDDSERARAGADCLIGGGGNDRLFGRGGADKLGGRHGADMLRGGPGADRLRGGPGRDELIGGAGADVIRSRGGGRDQIHCDAKDEVRAGKNDEVYGC